MPLTSTLLAAAAREAALQKIAAEYLPKLPEEARETVGSALARIDTPWMRWLLDYDPVPSLREMQCEVLAMFGGKDLQVEPAQNRPPLEAALADRAKPAKVVTVRGVNHLFQHTETGRPSEYGQLEEDLRARGAAADAGVDCRRDRALEAQRVRDLQIERLLGGHDRLVLGALPRRADHEEELTARVVDPA